MKECTLRKQIRGIAPFDGQRRQTGMRMRLVVKNFKQFHLATWKEFIGTLGRPASSEGPKQIKTVFCLTKRVVKGTKGRTRDYYLYHWCGLFSILGIARQEDGNVNSGNFCPENIPILRFIFVSSSHSGGGGVVSGFQGLISHRLSWFFVCAVWQCFTT